MLQITTMDGTIITGNDRIELATQLADHEHGDQWDNGQPPFIDHSVTWDYIESLELYDLRRAEQLAGE